MKTQEWTGAASTVEAAIAKGLKKLGLSRDQVEIKVLGEKTSGLFSLFGFRRMEVKLIEKPGARRFDRDERGGRGRGEGRHGRNEEFRNDRPSRDRDSRGRENRDSSRGDRPRNDRSRDDSRRGEAPRNGQRGDNHGDGNRFPRRDGGGRDAGNRNGNRDGGRNGSGDRPRNDRPRDDFFRNDRAPQRDRPSDSSRSEQPPRQDSRPDDRPRDRDNNNDRGGDRNGRRGNFDQRPRNDSSRNDRPQENRSRDSYPPRDNAPRDRDAQRPPQDVPSPDVLLNQWKALLGWDDLAWTPRNGESGDITLVLDAASGERLTAEGGQTLESLQHLLNVVRSKSDRSAPRVFLEIEGQAPMGENRIVEEARNAAAEVQRTGEPFSLQPMDSRDRRLVHQTLANHPDVETASEGDGQWRKVVVKPKNRG